MKRLLTFLTHLFFYLPLSLIINVCAILPIGLFFMGDRFEFVFIIVAIAGLAIAFALSKLRLRIKGKRTDDYYEVAYTKVNCLVEHDGSYTRETWWAEDSTEIKSENTVWGWIGIALSFIAFPLQVVALIASLLALVFPVLYSTTNRLPHEEDFSIGNRILYILFDFVIIPREFQRENGASALGVLFIPLYLIAVAGGFVLSGLIVNQLMFYVKFKGIDIGGGVLTLFLALLAVAAVLVTVLSLIKNIIALIRDYSTADAFLRMLKLFGIACAAGVIVSLLEFI